MKNIKYIILSALLLMACEEQKIDTPLFGSIKGKIVDSETYEGLAGVMVMSNPATTSVLTKSDGSFTIGKAKVGDHTISAYKDDYINFSVNVTVYEDMPTNLTFFLLKDLRNSGWVDIYDPVPGNGAVDQKQSLVLQWQVDQQYSNKDLEYSVYYYEATQTVQQLAGENLTVKEVVLSNLKSETTYYWYVVAKYEGDRVANSPTWSFATSSYD